MKEFTLQIHCPCCAAIFVVEKKLDPLPKIAVQSSAWEDFERLGEDRLEVLEILQVRQAMRRKGKVLPYYSAVEVLELCEIAGPDSEY